jgi:hypothetical protein
MNIIATMSKMHVIDDDNDDDFNDNHINCLLPTNHHHNHHHHHHYNYNHNHSNLNNDIDVYSLFTNNNINNEPSFMSCDTETFFKCLSNDNKQDVSIGTDLSISRDLRCKLFLSLFIINYLIYLIVYI